MRARRVYLDELREFAKSYDETIMQTSKQLRKFYFALDKDGFHFTPISTDKPRFVSNHNIERFLERFNQNRSASPKDYLDISANASYLLVLIERYFQSRN